MTQKEVVDKVTLWVNTVHKGSWMAAFMAEDTDQDGKLDSDEVICILAKAKIGMFRAGRWLIVQEILLAMDFDSDGKISYQEFARIAHVG
jgi:Ca2+-binding EF-hand superfamily protein